MNGAAGVLLAWAGALLFGVGIARRGAGEQGRSLPENVFVALFAAFLLAATAGVVAAEAGLFGGTALAVAAWVAAAIAMPRRGPRTVPSAGRDRGPAGVTVRRVPSGRALLAVLVLVAAAVEIVLLATPVVDARLEARDPGTYRLTAARLARTGRLTYEDEIVRRLPSRLREELFPRPRVLSRTRGMGFYLESLESGRVVPQFLPVAPALMAQTRLVAGAGRSGAAVLFASVLAAWALFWAGRRMVSDAAAGFAACMLNASVACWWFVRYGTAEPFAQALLFVGLWALARARRRPEGVLDGVLAGWAIGLLWLTKLETLLLALPLAGVFLFDLLAGRLRQRSVRAFWWALLALAAHFFIHAWFWSYPYVHDVLLIPGVSLASVTAVAGAGALLVAGALIRAASGRALVPAGWAAAASRCHGDRLRAAAAAALAVFCLWLAAGGGATGWDVANVRHLGWLVSPLGLAAALAGVVWLVRGRPAPGAGAPLALLVGLALTTLYNRQIIPYLLWAYRRYMTAVLPLTLLGIGVLLEGAAAGGLRLLRRRGLGARAAGAASLAAVAAVAVTVLWQTYATTRRYLPFHDLRGSAEAIARLEATVPAGSLALFEPRTRRGLLRFEGALAHELGRDVLRLPSPSLERETIAALVQLARRRGGDTYLLTTGYLTAEPWLGAEFVREVTFETTRLQDAWMQLPDVAERVFIRARVYRLLDNAGLAPLPGRLDVGAADDLYLDGPSVFQVEEEEGGRNYRWTGPTGRFFLRGLDGGARRILVRAAGGYPPERGQQRVEAFLDGQSLGEVVVRRGWREYSFAIPAGWQPPAGGLPTLTLVSEPAWSPAEQFGSGDPRRVGIAVDLIRWGR